jgi:predicted ATP-grasp superfamily ATP-dependent carboligase
MSEPTPLSPEIRGLTYPLTVSNGSLSTSVDYALITQQIRSVIETRYYERVMRADYGIGDYVLEVLDPAQINSAIQYSITQNVSGLTELSVQGDWKTQGDDGIYRIFIQYSVNGVPQPSLSFSLAN